MPLDYKVITIKDLVNEGLRGVTLFAYSGLFSRAVTDDLVAQLDNVLTTSSLSTRIKKKAFNISIEVLQNLYHYLESKSNEGHLGEGVIVVAELSDRVEITSGNYLPSAEINSLKSRIDMVNSLSEEELGSLYRGVLQIGGITEKGGAGLGFIDMKKKSGNKLEYSFTEVGDEYSLYILKITT